MEIIYIRDFDCDGCSYDDIMINISRHCHLTPSDEIAIYGSPKHKYFVCNDDSITFPKVVYVDKLDLGKKATLVNVLPDLKKISIFWPDGEFDIDDFGKIQEINYFSRLSNFLFQRKREYFNIKTKCEPLGNVMYRFTSDKGSWNIKVNVHN